MTDTINVNGSFANAASAGAFGKKGDMANANWLNQDYNLKARFAAMKAKTPIDPNSPQYNQLKQSINTHNANNAARMAAERADARAQAAAARVQAAAARAQYSQMRRSADEDNRLYTRRASISDAARNALYPSQRANVLNRARGIPGADLSGLTPLAGTYYNQEAHRIGSVGTSAANRGNFSQFMRSDKILTKMSSTLEKYVKANIHTQEEQEAARVTARRVLAGSFSQMSSAAEFAPGLSGMAMRLVISGRAARARAAAGGDFVSGYGGGGVGGAGGGGGKGGLPGWLAGAAGAGIEGIMAAAGPVGWALGGAAALAGASYEGPNAIAGAYGSTLSASQNYIRLKNFVGAQGLAAGYNSDSISNSIFNPKGVPSAMMQKYGYGSDDIQNIMQAYGLNPASAGGFTSVINSVGSMKFMPGLAGMGDATHAQIARMEAMGNMDSNSTQKFAKLMTDAVSAGADKSEVFKGIAAIITQNAALGYSTSGAKAAFSLNSTMLSSGAIGARSGALQQNFATAMQGVAAGIGTDPLTTMAMYNYMNAKGGAPKTDSQAKKLLGKDVYNKQNQTADGRAKIAALETAPNMNIAASALKDIIGNNPQLLNSIVTNYTPLGSMPTGVQVRYWESQNMSAGAYYANQSGSNAASAGSRLNNFGDIMKPGTHTLMAYPTKKAGLAAMAALLQRYPSEYHADTISSIINRYAPASDGNPTSQYIKNVSGWMHTDPNAKLNLKNPKQLHALMAAIIRQEGTGSFSAGQISDILGGGGAQAANLANIATGKTLSAESKGLDTTASMNAYTAGAAALVALGPDAFKAADGLTALNSSIVQLMITLGKGPNKPRGGRDTPFRDPRAP